MSASGLTQVVKDAGLSLLFGIPLEGTIRGRKDSALSVHDRVIR